MILEDELVGPTTALEEEYEPSFETKAAVELENADIRSVKFYCLNTGRVLKRRAFIEIPIPTAVIAKVNTIGKKENQGKKFRFLNRNKEPFDWKDEIPDDDGEFQGLLGEEASFPDISSELPGVILEDKLVGPTTALEKEYEPAFEIKAVIALDNADIQVDKQLRADWTQVDNVPIMVAQPH